MARLLILCLNPLLLLPPLALLDLELNSFARANPIRGKPWIKTNDAALGMWGGLGNPVMGILLDGILMALSNMPSSFSLASRAYTCRWPSNLSIILSLA
jgi:hypothetical protein